MTKHLSQMLAPLVLALILIFSASPVMAQQVTLSDADIDATILQSLPDGVTIGTATAEQLSAAVTQAIAANPGTAPSVAARTIRLRPDLAAAIVTAAVTASPQQAVEITRAAIAAAPRQAESITAAAAAAAPDQADAIQQAAASISQSQPPGNKSIFSSGAEEGESPPASDEQPASPTSP